MDIKDSSYSNLKTNQPDTARSSSDIKAAAASTRLKETSDSPAQNTVPLDLKRGQMVRGQIIDLRYHEVKVQLEPQNQVVTARLSGDVALSIGQEADFQVTGSSPDSLVLKYIPDQASQSADAMIQKALAASDLPMTDLNKAIVQELLNHGMPIDKLTLQSLIQLFHTNREASPLTLVLMLKNNIPLTAENIRQFEAYQNGTHQLLNDIRSIAANLTRLITQPENFLTSSSLMDLSPEVSASDGQIGNGTSPILNQINNQSDPAADPYTAQEGLQITEDQLQATGASLDVISSASLKSGVLKDSYQVIDKLINISSKLIGELTDNINMTELPADNTKTAATVQSPNILSEGTSIQNNSVLAGQLMDTNTSGVISEFLNPSERTDLLNYMNSFPDTDGIKDQIADGTASLKKVLAFIRENLSGSVNDSTSRLLASSEYTKLLENAFLQKWTITPDKLAKKTPVSDLYKNLQADMEDLSRLIKAGANTEEALKLQEPVKNLQENLQFMKDLNDVFTYIQLPVNLKDKQLHSDLYVFKRKKALKEKPDNISVLLHLDMDHLGPLNVYITLNNKSVQAKFYMADSGATQLVTDNLSSLTDVLSRKGYQLQSEVINTYKEPDFSRDFIEDDTGDGDIRRYTFDIRT